MRSCNSFRRAPARSEVRLNSLNVSDTYRKLGSSKKPWMCSLCMSLVRQPSSSLMPLVAPNTMEMTMHPNELLEQLKASATPRKAKNLDIIHAVSREQYERGSTDFSVATISKIAQERGGPVKSTIHN